MYGKPAMTCFKYQVYLYGSEAITYLRALLWVVTEPALVAEPSHVKQLSLNHVCKIGLNQLTTFLKCKRMQCIFAYTWIEDPFYSHP